MEISEIEDKFGEIKNDVEDIKDDIGALVDLLGSLANAIVIQQEKGQIPPEELDKIKRLIKKK